MTTIEKVLRIATQEKGVAEAPKGSNAGPVLKYGGKFGQPWCCRFVCWCWHEATGNWPTSAGNTGGTGTLWAAAKKDGTRVSAPQPGDIFYKARYEGGKRIGGHVGFVERVEDDGVLRTIEGNLRNAVRRTVRNPDGVIGFIRPKVREC